MQQGSCKALPKKSPSSKKPRKATGAGAGACTGAGAGGPADNGPEIARQVEQWRVQFSATNSDLKEQIEALKIKLPSEVKKHAKTTTLLGNEKLLKNGLEVNIKHQKELHEVTYFILQRAVAIPVSNGSANHKNITTNLGLPETMRLILTQGLDYVGAGGEGGTWGSYRRGC